MVGPVTSERLDLMRDTLDHHPSEFRVAWAYDLLAEVARLQEQNRRLGAQALEMNKELIRLRRQPATQAMRAAARATRPLRPALPTDPRKDGAG